MDRPALGQQRNTYTSISWLSDTLRHPTETYDLTQTYRAGGIVATMTRRRAEPISKRTAKNGSVTYEFRLDLGTRPDGGRDRRRFTYRTLAEARREYRRISTEVAAGTYVAKHAVTVAEFLTAWLDGRRDVRPVTLAGYRQALKPVIDRLGGIQLQQLTKAHLDELVAWRMESGRVEPRRLSERAQRVLQFVRSRPMGVSYAQVESEFGANAGKFLDRLREGGHVERPARGRYVAAAVADEPAATSGVSARTIVTMLVQLSAALDDAMAQGLVARNVARLVERPKVASQEMATWTREQAAQFRAHVESDRLYALWLLTLCGLRRSEVLGLRWSAVDFEAGTVSILSGRVIVPGQGTVEGDPKSARSRRMLPVPTDVIAALRSFRAAQASERLVIGPMWPDTGLVAVNPDGSPIRPETYSAEFARQAKAAGVPVIRLHDVRHTAATMMLDSGNTVSATAKWLGHDPGMTLRVYGHVYDDALQSAGASLLGSRAANE
ncbi:site-specific integrase [Gordonia amicalis]|uniref:site-specific integrase n=1 Tax=Gordonia amicalis TaxID=89053 RepID=UPI002955129C|nr:site-specific integrase [Gordonia amicalis]MDV7099707.1 site-specific integrase [Gordonia amicalis]